MTAESKTIEESGRVSSDSLSTDLAAGLSAELRMQHFFPRGEGSLSPLVSIRGVEPLSKIIIRIAEEDDAGRRELVKFFGCNKLPLNNKYVASTVSVAGVSLAGILLWLGPNEYMYRVSTEDYVDSEVSADFSNELLAGLEKVLVGGHVSRHVSFVDVSDYYAVVRVSGARARRVLQKNCPLDLHARAFVAGDCGQSVYGKSSILLSCASANTFAVQVRISMSGYLWELLKFSTISESC